MKRKLNYNIRSIDSEVSRLLSDHPYKIGQDNNLDVDVRKVAMDNNLSVVYQDGLGGEAAALDLETMTIALNENMRERLEKNNNAVESFNIARQIGVFLMIKGNLKL